MASKIRAERAIESSGLGYTLLRLAPVMGRGDTALSPTIISALQHGTFFTCGTGLNKVSLLAAANLGPLIHRILMTGPTHTAFNCCDAHVRWRTLVDEYAAVLGVPVPDRKRSVLSLIAHLADKRYLLLSTFCRFGATSPTTCCAAAFRFNMRPAGRWAWPRRSTDMSRAVRMLRQQRSKVPLDGHPANLYLIVSSL